ncbi:MAG TPA: DUF5681 domain-containing protein [Bacteroidales bacterium]|nr:DUF5681 domain-containing protein [Bacteroidales bacterium]
MAREDNIIPAKKGEVRNPKGRPKGSRNRSTIVKYWLEMTKKGRNPITEMAEVLEIQDFMTLVQIVKALKGDLNAYRELMDSAYGRIENNVKLNANVNSSQMSQEEFSENLKRFKE